MKEKNHPVVIPPIFPPIMVSVPLDPEAVNRAMQAASPFLKGALKISPYRLTFLVRGGDTVEILFSLPEGYIGTRRTPLRFQSDYHSSDITLDLAVDGSKVNPYPLPFTTDFDIDFGIYYVKSKEVLVTLMNDTTTDAEVTLQVTPHLIISELYHNWYAVLVKKSYECLTEFTRYEEEKR